MRDQFTFIALCITLIGFLAFTAEKKTTLTSLKVNLDSKYAESVGDADSFADGASVNSFTSLPNEIDDLDDYNHGSTDALSVDDLEGRLISYLDRTSEKQAKTRLDSLMKIRFVLSNKLMSSFAQDRRDTITEAIKRCLRKGKVDEQENAAVLASILFITLGSNTDSDVVFEELFPVLTSFLNDKSVAAKCREQCAFALAIGCFISPIGVDYLSRIMDNLFLIFSASFPNGEGVYPTLSPNIVSLHNTALNAWCLLVTLLQSNKVLSIAESNLNKLAYLLDSTDQELRLSAGESIALLHEISRESNPEFEMKSIDDLSNKLKELATYSQKFRSKKDRKVERSNFRDIMRTVLEYEEPLFTVKRKDEVIELNNWSKKIQYDVFCIILEGGCQIHLGENQLIRDILEIGQIPLDVNALENKKLRVILRSLFY